MPNYNQTHQFYAGVDLHARSMFVHVLSAKGKTVFERDLPAEPDAFLDAVKPFRKNLVVGRECMFAWYWLAPNAECGTRNWNRSASLVARSAFRVPRCQKRGGRAPGCA